MSTRAILKIDGQKFRVLKVTYAFSRKTDETGYCSGNVHFEHMDFTLESDKTCFFLQWMFEPTWQKSGTLSFYEEDGIKTIKQLIFGGAFCIDFREIFRSAGNAQMATKVRIAAGGVRVEESKFKFPWFKGPLVADVEDVADTSVEFAPPPQEQVKPKPAEKQKPEPKEMPVVAEEAKNVITDKNIFITKKYDTPGKAAGYTLSDKITGGEFAAIIVPYNSESGPELDLYPHEATLPNSEILHLKAGDVPITRLCLDKAIEIFKNQNGVPPKELPARIVGSNIKNFQKEFVILRNSGTCKNDDEALEKAARKISYGTHREAIGYTEIKVVKVSDHKDMIINGKLEKNVPRTVYLTARKPK